MFGKSGDERGVLSMTEREKEKRKAPLRLIETYWRGLAEQSGEIPTRSQIDPRGIESALEYAFLAEKIAPMLAKLRVAGTHLNDLMGMETGGMPLSALVAPEDRDRLSEGVARLFSEGALVRLDLRAEEGFGKGRIDAHMLLLPLRSDMGDMSRMIGALTTTGRIGRTPRRFKIVSMSIEPALDLLSQATVPFPLPGASSRAPGLERRRELSEPPAVFKHKTSGSESHAAQDNGAKPPYLRLVVSND